MKKEELKLCDAPHGSLCGISAPHVDVTVSVSVGTGLVVRSDHGPTLHPIEHATPHSDFLFVVTCLRVCCCCRV